MVLVVALAEAVPAPYVPLWVDVAAVALGALVGALVAARERFDIAGVLFVAIVSGLGGGMIRDLLLQQGPPVALTSAWLLPTAVVVGLVTFLLSRSMNSLSDRMGLAVLVLDAVFLAVFTVVGTLKALDAGLPGPSCVLLGTITGVGGGMLRDVLLARQPAVLRPGTLEAGAAVLGSTVQVLLAGLMTRNLAATLGLVVTVALRLLSVWRKWETPIAPVAAPESYRARWVRRWRGDDERDER
jgi:uncharacterized membrane protein YeiH